MIAAALRFGALPVLLAAALVVPGLSGCRNLPGGGRPERERLRARPLGAGAAARHPHAALGPRGEVVVVWGAARPDGRADIAFSRLDPSGGLEPPVRVNPRPGSAVAGRQVGPRVAVTPAGRIVVTWVDRGQDPSGDVVVAFSDDGGRTFSRPRRVNDDGGAAAQEYQDIAALADGSVAVVWLDERDAPRENENQKQVYLALSGDGGESFERNRALTRSSGGVCPCCRPALAASPDGALHLIYRDRDGEDLRITARTFRLQATPPAAGPALRAHAWTYPACPNDGPAIAAGPSGEVAAAWVDGACGRARLWVSVSRDGGETFQPPRAVEGDGGSGAAGDSAPPDGLLAAPDGRGAPEGCCAGRGGTGASGGLGEGREPARPALAVEAGTGVLVAWEDTEGCVWVERVGGGGRGEPRLLGGGGGRLASSAVLLSTPRGVRAFWTEETELGLVAQALGWGGEGVGESSSLETALVVEREGRIVLLRDAGQGEGEGLAAQREILGRSEVPGTSWE